MSERRKTGVTGLHWETREPVEVCDGDSVWGRQPGYYGDERDKWSRCDAGLVFWNALANDGAGEWRAVSDAFANAYIARDCPEHLGYPLAKFMDLLVMPCKEDVHQHPELLKV